MITWESALEKHCKGIESVILVERRRLKSTRDQLKRYGTNDGKSFEQERNESKRREEKIHWYSKQVSLLKSEYDNLRKAVIDAESRRLDESVFTHKKRSLKAVAAEIESCKLDIEKIDKKLHQIRQVNKGIEKEQQKRLREINAKHGFIIRPRSSGCLQLGRLMVEQEDAKQVLNSANDKKMRLISVIRELEKSLAMVEKQCKNKVESIRMKESEELERNLALVENAYERQVEINDHLERCLAKARSKLELLNLLLTQPKQCKDIDNLRRKIEEDTKLAESYRVNIAELNLVASTLYDDVIEVTKQKTQYAKNFMKNYEDAMRKVNLDVHKMKSENSELDGKIENIFKLNNWSKRNYEKKILEHEEEAPTGEERQLTRFRVEEDEARSKLRNLKESSKKVKEQIESMLDALFNAQLQCFMKERMVEETSNGLREVTFVNEMVVRKKISDN